MVDLKIFLCVAAVLCFSNYASGARRLVCFYDVWSYNRPSVGTYEPTDIDPYLCTHVILANAIIQKKKTKIYRRKVADMSRYEIFNNMTLTNPALKSLILLQESSGADLNTLVESADSRQMFTDSVIAFCRKHNFGGLAFSWNKPNATNFQTLSTDLRAAFDAENRTSTSNDRLLLVAQLAGKSIEDIDSYYDKYTIKSTITDNYDWVNIDSYDLSDTSTVTAHHSRLYEPTNSTGEEKFLNTKAVAEYYAFLGIPKSMINVGIPTYGRGYTLLNSANYGMGESINGTSANGEYTDTPGFLAYYEICGHLDNSVGAMYTDEGMPYWVNDTQWISYDDMNTVKEKAQWIADEEYGGAAVWSLSLDDFAQHCNTSEQKYPLINKIKAVFAEADAPKEYRRVCYFTTWSENRPGAGKLVVEDIDPFLCTHLIVAFAEISEDCLLEAEADNDTSIYQRAVDLKQTNPDLKVLLSVGGWEQGSESFSYMVSLPKRRRTFANSTIEFLRMHGFDGLDLAWQYPAQREGANEDTDKKNFGILTELLSRRFDDEVLGANMTRLMLTAAVAAEQEHIDYAYDVKALSENLDFLSIQTFDMHGYWDGVTGHHSQLKAFGFQTGTDANLNMDWSTKYWQMLGVVKEKINIGIAAFGRGFTVASGPDSFDIGTPAEGPSSPGNYTGEAGLLAYYELCKLQGSVYMKEGVPILYNNDSSTWLGYDDRLSVTNKMRWLVRQGFGGAMVWSLDLDDFNGSFCGEGDFPITNAMKTALTVADDTYFSTTISSTWRSTTTMSETTTPPPSTTQEAFINCTISETGGPYPNPNDCRTFYKCSHGVAHLYNCPGSLSYDRAHRVCNWDRHTNC